MNYLELRKIRHPISPTSREIEDFFSLTKRSFHSSCKLTGYTNSSLKSGCQRIVQTRKLLKTPRNQTYLISNTSRNRRLLEKTFFYWEKFQVFWKVTILAISRLKSDWIQMVQTDELLRTKKRQTYIISPTSRDRRLLEQTFFLSDREVSFSGKWAFWSYIDTIQTEYRWYKLMNN